MRTQMINWGCKYVGLIGLILCFAGLVSRTHAAPLISDEAELFTQEDEAEAQRIMATFESATGKAVRIETYRLMHVSTTNPQDNNANFARWHRKRMQQTGHKGVLILICMNPRWIEFGYDIVTGAQLQLPTKAEQIRMAFTADFKDNRFGDGLLAGLKKLNEFTISTESTPFLPSGHSPTPNDILFPPGGNLTIPNSVQPRPNPPNILAVFIFLAFFVFVVFGIIVSSINQGPLKQHPNRRSSDDFSTGGGVGMLNSLLMDSSIDASSSSSTSSSSVDSGPSFSSNSSDTSSSISSDSGSSSSGNAF